MKYVILGFFILLFILFVLNEAYLWIVMGKSQVIQVIKGKRRKDKYDAIAFGSAYCRCSIDFGGFNGYNFGIGSQFFYYTDKMLREIAPRCLKKGGTVFLIIADLVFAEEGKGLYEPDRYQLMLSKKTLGDEYNIQTFFKVRFPLFYNPLVIKNIAFFFAHKIYRFLFPKNNKPNWTEESARQAAISRCASWCKEFGLKDTKTTDIPVKLEENFKKSRSILTGMIQFCIDNGYRPVLVVTPVSKIMNDELGVGFIKRVLYDNIELSNKQNALFLDYLRDPRFADYKQYSQSADLLSSQERLHFTEILLHDSNMMFS